MHRKIPCLHQDFHLRHCQDPLCIDLDGGWADVDTIIQRLRKKYPAFDRKALEQIVAEDQKGRCSFDVSRRKLRANQGHSIPSVVIPMEQPEPPEYLYHGTATRFLDSILREGLKPMTRQYVHISPDYETAVKVGMRHGTPVVLRISARAFSLDGNDLFLSDNGVWLAKHVPVEYLELFERSYPNR